MHQCVFCNQETITGNLRQNDAELAKAKARETVKTYLAFKPQAGRKTELAFFGGNFLGISTGQISWYLDFARDLHQAGLINALRFSTRPDSITRSKLAVLANMPVSVVEIGAQSMCDEVLHQAGRGHTARDTEQAAALLREFGFNMGLQLMVGLPGDTAAKALETARRAVALKPVCARIYPTLVIKNSPLAQMYLAGAYTPLTLEDAVDISARLYRLFTAAKIKVIRMGLQATDDLQPDKGLLAGPYHPSFGHMVLSRLFLIQLQAALTTAASPITVEVHPGQISHVRGLGNSNLKALQSLWPQYKFSFIANNVLSKTKVAVNGQVYDIIN